MIATEPLKLRECRRGMAKGESPKIILAAMASADRGREDTEAMDQSKKGRFEVDPELGLGVAIHNPVPSGTS